MAEPLNKKEIHQLIADLCPDGVEGKRLGEVLVRNVGGGTPPKSNPAYWDGDIPWASIGDLTSEGLTLDHTRRSITQLGLDNSSSNLVNAGNVIVGVRVAPGRMKLATIDVAINQDMRGLELPASVNPKFLVHYFCTLSIQGTGVIVMGIKKKVLEDIQIPIPPLPIQEAIVTHLDRLAQLEAELRAELKAELERRRKQFVYYREQLLSFKPKAEDGAADE